MKWVYPDIKLISSINTDDKIKISRNEYVVHFALPDFYVISLTV